MKKLIGGIIFSIFSNLVALYIAAEFIKGFNFTDNFIDLIIAAGLLTLANYLIKPFLKLFLGPLIILTFGIFTIAINAIILIILDILINPLIIEGYIPLLLATLIISIVNFTINLSAKFLYNK
jgi:putative membrane protein